MKTLKKFDFPASTHGIQSVYDWPKLLDGGIHQLTEGEDFKCQASNFHSMAIGQSKKRFKNLKAHLTNESPIVVTLQATDMTQDEREAYESKIAERKAAKQAEKEAGDETETSEAA